MKGMYQIILGLISFALVAIPALGQDSNLEDNKALVMRFYDAVNAKDLSSFDEIFSEDFVDHSAPDQAPGIEAQRDSIASFFTSFPDLSVMNDAIVIAEADKVVVLHHFTGTQEGVFIDIEPTGRTVGGTAIDTWLIKDGKIAELWHTDELLQVVGQLTSPEPLPMPESMMHVGLGTGDPETNKALAQHFYEAFNSRNFDDYDNFISADVMDHNPVPEQKPGLAGLKEALQGFLLVFPDLQITIEDITTEGDLVSVRGVGKGTHQGEFLGVPPTGKEVSFGYTDVYRIKDGMIVEAWHVEELLQTLGFLTAQ